MKRKLTYSIALAMILTTLSGAASAGPKNKPHKKQKAAEENLGFLHIQQDAVTEDLIFGKIFSQHERDEIRKYFAQPQSSLPPGLAKRQSLPPGLQKHVNRTGHLPPGLEKQQLPGGLLSRLPKRSPDYERLLVGQDVMLVDQKTGLILDIMQNIFGVPVDKTLEKGGVRRQTY